MVPADLNARHRFQSSMGSEAVPSRIYGRHREAGPEPCRVLSPSRVGLPVAYSGPSRGAVSIVSSASLPSVAATVRLTRRAALFALLFPSTNIAPPWMGSGERNSLLSVAKLLFVEPRIGITRSWKRAIPTSAAAMSQNSLQEACPSLDLMPCPTQREGNHPPSSKRLSPWPASRPGGPSSLLRRPPAFGRASR